MKVKIATTRSIEIEIDDKYAYMADDSDNWTSEQWGKYATDVNVLAAIAEKATGLPFNVDMDDVDSEYIYGIYNDKGYSLVEC